MTLCSDDYLPSAQAIEFQLLLVCRTLYLGASLRHLLYVLLRDLRTSLIASFSARLDLVHDFSSMQAFIHQHSADASNCRQSAQLSESLCGY